MICIQIMHNIGTSKTRFLLFLHAANCWCLMSHLGRRGLSKFVLFCKLKCNYLNTHPFFCNLTTMGNAQFLIKLFLCHPYLVWQKNDRSLVLDWCIPSNYSDKPQNQPLWTLLHCLLEFCLFTFQRQQFETNTPRRTILSYEF